MRLIITEKNNAAAKIAEILAKGKLQTGRQWFDWRPMR